MKKYRRFLPAALALTLLCSGAALAAAGYTLITLTSGQTLSLDVGCEVLLRVGTATVRTNDSSAALVDVSAGGTVNNGAALTKNHLYMSTIAGRTLTPTSGTVKLLIRGGHRIG